MKIDMLAVLLIRHSELVKLAQWWSYQWAAAVAINVRLLCPGRRHAFRWTGKMALMFRVWGINAGKEAKNTE